MTDPLVDLRALLQGLREHRVDYLLFGAIAMVFYGCVRNTEDLDIVVSPMAENLDRVSDWLISIGAVLKLNPARQFGPRERWRLQRGSNATVITKMGQVDVVQRLDGLPAWAELIEQAETYELDGEQVKVMNRRTLIELKRHRNWAQDVADVEAIELIDKL